MDKTANYYGITQKKSNKTLGLRPPSNKPPPPSNKPPPTKLPNKPKFIAPHPPKPKNKTSTIVIGKNDKIISTNQIIPINFEKSKYSTDEFVSFFEKISTLKNIDDIQEQFELFASDDVDNSYSTEILNYILKNFTYLQIKFIASLFLNSESKQIGLLFERFLVNQDNLLDVINLNKFCKKLSEGSYVKQMEEFGVNNIQYKSLFKEILDQFDKTLIFKFFNEYIDQEGNELLNMFYLKFLTKHKTEIRDFENEKKRIIYEKKKNKEDEYQKRYQQKQLEQMNEKNIICINFYKKAAWINEEFVVKILISKDEQTDYSRLSHSFDEFIVPNTKTYLNEIEWHEANDKYFLLQCDDNVNKKQDGYTLFFFNNGEELLIGLKIAYLTSTDKILYQDESIYNAERTFFANLDSKLNEMSVMKILDEPISDDVKQLGQLMFKNALGQFSSSGKYMNLESIEKSSLSVRDYVSHLSEVIVYLNLDNVSDSIFGKRIKKEYYKDDALFKLTEYEKIPELEFNDEKYANIVNSYINKKINNFVYKFGEDIYIIRNRFNNDYKRRNDEEEDDDLKLKFKSIQAFCKSNKKSPSENLVIYTNDMDSSEKTCYNLKDLVKSISNKNFDVDIDEIFKQRIIEIYDVEYILNPTMKRREFPIMNLIVNDILSMDISLSRREIEEKLHMNLIIEDEILLKQDENIDEDEEEEEEGDEIDEEDDEEEEENVVAEGDEVFVKDDDEDEEEDDEDEEEEEEEEGEEEEEEEDVVEEDSTTEEEDSETDTDTDSETDTDADEDDVQDLEDLNKQEKTKQYNKFNDYIGMSEQIFETDELTCGRNQVKGDGNCYFRALYLAIIYNNIDNFKRIPIKLRPDKLIFMNKNFSDVNQFSRNCRKYISENYDGILNNIIDFGHLMTNKEIYPNSKDALFGEAGKCYVKYRGNQQYTKKERIDVKHENQWVPGKIIKVKKVEIEDDDDEDEDGMIYNIKTDEGLVLKNVLSKDIMKEGAILNFFTCAKKQILNKDVYPTSGEINLIIEYIQEHFEIKNIILSASYDVQHLNSDEVETNLEIIKDILDKNGNPKDSFRVKEKVKFRKHDHIKGRIKEVNGRNFTILSKKDKQLYKDIDVNAIITRNREKRNTYELNEKILFRLQFKLGKIVKVTKDSTLTKNLSDQSKEKIEKEILNYEMNKNPDKIQIYLLTDNVHYNYLTVDKDDEEDEEDEVEENDDEDEDEEVDENENDEEDDDGFKILEMGEDGNFTNNLLNYLDGKTIDTTNFDGNGTESDGEGDNDYTEYVDNGDDEEDDEEEDDDGGKKYRDRVCENCHKQIHGNNFYKTKNFDSNKKIIKSIYFCGIPCFKDFEKWK